MTATKTCWGLGGSTRAAGRRPVLVLPITLKTAMPVQHQLFSARRMFFLCGSLLAIEAALFLYITAGTYGLIVPLKKPTSTDFVSFYAAGSLADAGTPRLAYDQAAHYAAEQHATQPGIAYNFFYYPPPYLLLCAAFAKLPYIRAFVVFETVTLGFYCLVVRRILGERGWAILIPILAFPPVLWTIGVGQNGLLTAGLLGAATLLVDRRPLAAGLLFGVLSCKPHFALLVPIALAAGGRWRALLQQQFPRSFSVSCRRGCSAGRPGAIFLLQRQHPATFMPRGGFRLAASSPRLAEQCCSALAQPPPQSCRLLRPRRRPASSLMSGGATRHCRSAPHAWSRQPSSRCRWRCSTILSWPGSPALGCCAPMANIACRNGEN